MSLYHKMSRRDREHAGAGQERVRGDMASRGCPQGLNLWGGDGGKRGLLSHAVMQGLSDRGHCTDISILIDGGKQWNIEYSFR